MGIKTAWLMLLFRMQLSAEVISEDVLDFLCNDRAPVSNETGLTKNLSRMQLLWEFPKGESYTIPVIKSPRVIFSHVIDDILHVACLHEKTGKALWTFKREHVTKIV